MIHTTPLLEAAQFLPVRDRIDYKIALSALLTFKFINNQAPSYLTKTITLKPQITKTLRRDTYFFLLEMPNIFKILQLQFKELNQKSGLCIPSKWSLEHILKVLG